jgi:hypothetical protein
MVVVSLSWSEVDPSGGEVRWDMHCHKGFIHLTTKWTVKIMSAFLDSKSRCPPQQCCGSELYSLLIIYTNIFFYSEFLFDTVPVIKYRYR